MDQVVVTLASGKGFRETTSCCLRITSPSRRRLSRLPATKATHDSSRRAYFAFFVLRFFWNAQLPYTARSP